MRYVSAAFLESTLRRGKSLEQFLGGAKRDGEQAIRWLELRPRGESIQVWQFVAPDLGDPEHLDFHEFQGDDDGELIAQFPSGAEALSHAQRRLGASSERWVNQFVAQDDYRDFILAGRPQTWPNDAV